MPEYQIDPSRPDYKNVTEYYEIHDTIAVGLKNATEKENVTGWYPNYAEFGAVAEHTFFNSRNKGEVGLPYNNLDTKDQMPFVFHIYSVGLRFIAPAGLVEPSVGETPSDWNALAHVLWSATVQEHTSLTLTVREDDKLKNNGMLTPEGSGPNGIGIAFSGSVNSVINTAVTPGDNKLQNRFPFPDPIEVARGSTYSVTVTLSRYIQQVLQALPGPSNYTFNNGTAIADAKEIPARSMVRVSLIGRRAVQQRGEQHF